MTSPRSLVTNIAALWSITSRPIRRAMGGMVLLGIVSSFMESLGVSLAILLIYNAVSPGSLAKANGVLGTIFTVVQRISSHNPFVLAGIIAGLVVATSLCTGAYGLLTAWIKNTVYHTVRATIFEQYLSLSYDYVAQKDYGYLTNTLQVETWYISEAINDLSRMAINLCSIVVFGVILVGTSWPLALVTVASGLLYLGTVRAARGTLRRKSEQATEMKEEMAEAMFSGIQGMRTIRLFSFEKAIVDRYRDASDHVRRIFMSLEFIGALIKPLAELTTLLLVGAIVWASSAIGNTTATTLTVIALVYRLQPHIREIQDHLVELAGMTASINTVLDAMEREGKPYPPKGTVDFVALKHDIVLDDLTYRHRGSTEPSLSKIDARIAKGSTTVIVGPSGAGKTTLANLILHLYEPTDGKVLVDGTDLAEIRRTHWLQRVVAAGQDLDLIEGTILDNVRLASPNANLEEVRSALELAGILEFVDALPDGLGTFVGERGLRLSGGQRQRIALARVFVTHPDVLILDEATNAIDSSLEREIYSNLRRHYPDLTLIVIAHRSSACIDADQVLVLDNGRLLDSGSPEDLRSRSNQHFEYAFQNAATTP